MSTQLYCTVHELVTDLSLNGAEDPARLLGMIRSASEWIARKTGGNFIPVRAEKTYNRSQVRGHSLYVDPLLSVESINSDGRAVTDYDLYPFNRHYPDGPYSRIYTEQVRWGDEIKITGLWGKYQHSEPLGLTVTQTATDTSLTVADGSILSIGAVLGVGAEQQLVTGYGDTSPLTSSLVGTITSADEEITITNGAEVKQGEVIQLSAERMYVRGVAGNKLVVIRGYEGTAKQAHTAGAAITVQRTYTVERGVNGTESADHSNAAVSRLLPPYDVNYLARQIAGLMLKKTATGFVGRSGNADTGETFYVNEFPDKPIKEIIRNYRITQL